MEEELITILSRNKHKEQTPFPLGEGRGEAPLGECHVEEELIPILSRNKYKEQTPFPLGEGRGEASPLATLMYVYV